MTKIINISKIVTTIHRYSHNNTIPKENLFSQVVKSVHPAEGKCVRRNYQKHMDICKDLCLIHEEGLNFILTETFFNLHLYLATPQDPLALHHTAP